MMGCKENEEVAPQGTVVPVTVVTNHVRITLNSLEVGDYLDVTSSRYGAAVYMTRPEDAYYYFCNLMGNLVGFQRIGNCDDNTIELIALEGIYIDYAGDVTIEYLEEVIHE